MNPERKKIHEEGFSKALERKPSSAKKRTAVANENIIFCGFKTSINGKAINADAATKPKNRPAIGSGCSSSSSTISPEIETIVLSIPAITGIRKRKFTFLICFINPGKSAFKILPKLKAQLLIFSRSCSYMPRTRAIVPPDTPGTTSAIPIAIPLKRLLVNFFKREKIDTKLFIVFET